MTTIAHPELDGLDRYKFGWADSDAAGSIARRGLSEEVVRDISALKDEPEWMLDLRLKGLKLFRRKPMPSWGSDLSGIDFENIKYFVRSTEKQAASWEELPADIKNTYDRLGIPEAEKQRLVAGVAAQYESEVVYHKIREDLEEKGVIIRTVKFNESDCTLDMQDLAAKIGNRTRLVAVGYASNAVGTINNVAEVVRLARQAGALSYIDAVHYAPHGPIDVRALDCDFLVCSTYKFFGPHMGVLYGKRDHLKKLHPYKVRPNTDNIPNCWEWGTLNHECIAGIKACVDYWEELGRRTKPAVATRRAAILAAHEAIHWHERKMMEKMIAGLLAIPGLKLYGITDPRRFENRCATIVVRIEGHTPLELATKLGARGFFTWDGNYYALNVTEQLDVERLGGFLRIGLVHYNTMEEVDGLLAALREIVRG